ncbi:hypothetical protein MHI39_12510 [Heyndrickxia sp. FSL K6-6286]|nr:hypothetical protein [Heyndrickxia oleronia]MEC1374279.1 hypothetical protein [Heyndrickxia oleronia]GIN40936.1 hypothetical protein J19TS1_38850 [Heyndrickxia oleronia]
MIGIIIGVIIVVTLLSVETQLRNLNKTSESIVHLLKEIKKENKG